MDKKEQIAEQIKIIGDATAKLEELRESCEHKEGYTVGWFSWRVGAMDLSRICGVCKMPSGDPSDEERATFTKKEKQEQKKFLEAQGHSPETIAQMMSL